MDVRQFTKILGVIAAISVGAAVLAALTDRPINAVAVPPRLLEGLQLDKVARLEITHGLGLSGTRAFNFVRKDGQWLVRARDYPAHQELVNEALLALAQIEVLEARTANPDWHRLLGLAAPEDIGKAIRYRLYDENGDALASVLLGRTQQSEAERTASPSQNFAPLMEHFYIRKEGDAQSWLARGRLPRSPELAAWLSPRLPLPPRATLTDLIFAENQQFDMRQEAAKIWLDQLYALRPDEIAPRSDIAFDTGKNFTLSTDSGLKVHFAVVGVATTVWLAAQAEGQGAGAINAVFANWAYRFAASAAPILFPEAIYFNRDSSVN